MRRKNCNGKIFAVIFIFLPALLFGLISLYYFLKTGNPPLPVPQWNDEAAYYALIKTWLSTGMPEGYWGYGGEHAIIGTGSAWNPAVLLPYAVWGMMFGWNYSSAAFANVAFLCIANAAVLLLLGTERKTVVRLILLECVSGNILLYMNTIMSELLRYALALVLAAMLYRLLKEDAVEEKNTGETVFRYIVVPLYLLFLVQVYIFFAFAIPIYIFAVWKKKKWYWKTALSLVVMTITAGGSYYLLHLISSNYDIGKMEVLLLALQKLDILGAVKDFIWMLKVGLLDLWNCFLSPVGHGMFHWFVLFLAVLGGASFVLLCVQGYKWFRGRKAAPENKFWRPDRQALLITAYSTGIFVFMYITVYSLEAFTFFRGLGIVILFSFIFLIQMENRRLYMIFFVFYAAGLLFVPFNMADFNEERYITRETKEEWDALAQGLEEALPLEEPAFLQMGTGEEKENSGNVGKEEQRWAKTAMLYTMEPKLICAMPAGIGINFAMYSDELVEEAGYLVFSLERKENLRQDWLEQSYEVLYGEFGGILEEEYAVQYMDERYVVYKKCEV